MRIAAVSVFVMAVSCCSIRADDAADAKAIVAKAIKAAGMKPDDKSFAMTWKDKGTFTGGGFTMPYTGDWAYQGPDKYRFDISGDVGGMKVQFLVVVNGNKAWETAFGQKQEITGEKLETLLNEVYQMHVLSLVPLVNDKEFKLSTAGEKDVNGKKAVLVKVEHDKRPNITLYFDKSSGLLLKDDIKVKDEFQGWKEVLDEGFFEDYKEIGGHKYYTKLRIIRDGKPMIEGTLSDQKIQDKLDPKLFEKP